MHHLHKLNIRVSTQDLKLAHILRIEDQIPMRLKESSLVVKHKVMKNKEMYHHKKEKKKEKKSP